MNAANFDSRAAEWDDNLLRAALAKGIAAAIRESVPLAKTMSAMEFGCGTGLISREVFPMVGTIKAIDMSPGMIGQLQKRITENGLQNITARCLDIFTDPPNEFYGKIMSLGDDAIVPCFTLLTDTSIETIEDMKKRMAGGGNPMVYKKMLAFELTKQFNSESDAENAQKEFETRFQKGELVEAHLPHTSITVFASGSVITDDLITLNLASSKSEARRLIEQKAVKHNNRLVSDPKEQIEKNAGDIFQVGRKAVKITK